MTARPMSFQMKQLKSISKIVAAPSAGSLSADGDAARFAELSRAQSLLAAYVNGR